MKQFPRNARVLTGGFACILIAVVLVWTAVTLVSRARAERDNKAVEICLDLNEVIAYCQLNKYPLKDFAQRCRAIGVSGLVLGEESIGSMASGGKLIYFPGTEYSRMRLLDLVPPASEVGANSLVTADKALANDMVRLLDLRYGIAAAVKRSGRYYVIVPSFAKPFAPGFWGECLWIGFDPEKLKFGGENGFEVYVRPENIGSPSWLETVQSTGVAGVLWDGKETAGFPGKTDITARWIKDRGLKLVNLEFTFASGMESLRGDLISRLITGHVIPEAELNRGLDPSIWTKRWNRAARERGVRFMLFHLWENKPVEENLAYLRQTARSLKNAGFTLQPASTPGYPNRGYHGFRLLLAAGIGIFIPLLALAEGKKLARPIPAFLAVNGITIAGGLCISALLYDLFFMQKVLAFPYVKLTMLAPVALAVFLLYPPERIREFWKTPIEMKHVLIGAAALAAVFVLIERSGNSAAEWLRVDTGVRQWLEDVFLARPRTKEFLIGQPFLFLGLFYRKPALILIGMIGQVSVINSFLHAHTPVALTLTRTLHGLWLGLAVAYAVILAAGSARKVFAPSRS